MTAPRTDPQFFEHMYAVAPGHDPWSFASDAYERNRYATLLSALPDREFERCLEPGCSIGELTALLATRCHHVLAFDVSPTAVEKARARFGALPNIEFQHGLLPDHLACDAHHYDLICLSEIGYYFTTNQLVEVATATSGRLAARAVVLAGHWTGSSRDHVLSGEEVHDTLDATFLTVGLQRVSARRHHPGFIVDVWQRNAAARS